MENTSPMRSVARKTTARRPASPIISPVASSSSNPIDLTGPELDAHHDYMAAKYRGIVRPRSAKPQVDQEMAREARLKRVKVEDSDEELPEYTPAKRPRQSGTLTAAKGIGKRAGKGKGKRQGQGRDEDSEDEESGEELEEPVEEEEEEEKEGDIRRAFRPDFEKLADQYLEQHWTGWIKPWTAISFEARTEAAEQLQPLLEAMYVVDNGEVTINIEFAEDNSFLPLFHVLRWAIHQKRPDECQSLGDFFMRPCYFIQPQVLASQSGYRSFPGLDRRDLPGGEYASVLLGRLMKRSWDQDDESAQWRETWHAELAQTVNEMKEDGEWSGIGSSSQVVNALYSLVKDPDFREDLIALSFDFHDDRQFLEDCRDDKTHTSLSLEIFDTAFRAMLPGAHNYESARKQRKFIMGLVRALALEGARYREEKYPGTMTPIIPRGLSIRMEEHLYTSQEKVFLFRHLYNARARLQKDRRDLSSSQTKSVVGEEFEDFESSGHYLKTRDFLKRVKGLMDHHIKIPTTLRDMLDAQMPPGKGSGWEHHSSEYSRTGRRKVPKPDKESIDQAAEEENEARAEERQRVIDKHGPLVDEDQNVEPAVRIAALPVEEEREICLTSLRKNLELVVSEVDMDEVVRAVVKTAFAAPRSKLVMQSNSKNTGGDIWRRPLLVDNLVCVAILCYYLLDCFKRGNLATLSEASRDQIKIQVYKALETLFQGFAWSFTSLQGVWGVSAATYELHELGKQILLLPEDSRNALNEFDHFRQQILAFASSACLQGGIVSKLQRNSKRKRAKTSVWRAALQYPEVTLRKLDIEVVRQGFLEIDCMGCTLGGGKLVKPGETMQEDPKGIRSSYFTYDKRTPRSLHEFGTDWTQRTVAYPCMSCLEGVFEFQSLTVLGLTWYYGLCHLECKDSIGKS